MNDGVKVGDYITDFSCIYRVTAVKQGEGGKMVHFRPHSSSDKVFTATLPLDGFKKAGMRKVLTLTEIKKMLAELKEPVGIEYDIMTAKEEMYRNEPSKISSVLVYYWGRRDFIGKPERDMLEQIVEHLCQEVAVANDKKYPETRKMIVALLDKYHHKQEKPV